MELGYLKLTYLLKINLVMELGNLKQSWAIFLGNIKRNLKEHHVNPSPF